MPVEVEEKVVIYIIITQIDLEVKLLHLFVWRLNRRTINPLSGSLTQILVHW